MVQLQVSAGRGARGSPVSGFAGRTQAARKPFGSAAADEAAVLREQLDYLVKHARNCSGRCPDCARFRLAREALMKPWE